MHLIYSLFLIFCLTACSTKPSHVGSPQTTKSDDEFSIQDNNNGFTVAGHYSEYQFIRNSRDGFVGCTKLINNAAKEHSLAIGKHVNIPKWEDVTIVDHGRDLITAVMHVNCQYDYTFQVKATGTNVDKLTQLADLYKQGLLTKSEFDNAKSRLLSE